MATADENLLKEVLKKQKEINEKANTERENLLGEEINGLKKAYNFRAAADRMRMADVKTAIDNKKKAQAAEETLLLATANNLGVTVDELKSQYKEIKVNPDKVSELIFKPFEDLSKALVDFEVGFSKNLSGASGAIKELTGGLIDLGQFAEDGADKVKAVGTLLATPFKLANTAVAKVSKAFTGKELNFGQDLQNWWSGTEKEINGETVKADGFKDRFLTSIPGAFKSFGEGLKGVADGLYNGINAIGSGVANFASGALGLVEKGIMGAAKGIENVVTGVMDGVKDFGLKAKEMAQGFATGAVNFAKGTRDFAMKSVSFMAGLGRTAMAMGRQAIAFAVALPGLIASGIAFVGGLLATAAGMLIAAAPFIGIGLLIGVAVAAVVMGVMFLVKNFESIKTTISEKVGGAIDKVKGFIQGFTDFFVNVWQSISDWVRGKILGIKKKLFGLSDEEQEELDGINERKDSKKKAKATAKEQQKLAEVQAEEQYQAMLESGELEGKSRREKRRLKKGLEKSALIDIKEEANFQATSSEDLLKERDRSLERSKQADDLIAQKEKAVSDRVDQLEIADQTGGIIDQGKKLSGADSDAYIAREAQKTKDEQDKLYGTDEEIRRFQELDNKQANKNQMELLTREDYIPSKVLEGDEQDQVKADSLGISLDEYRAKRESEEDDFGSSEFSMPQEVNMMNAVDRADGDRIKDAADRAEEAKDMGPPAPPVNMANNAVQQVNVSNNRKVIQDPAPHNPDPTGSRLSVVPA